MALLLWLVLAELNLCAWVYVLFGMQALSFYVSGSLQSLLALITIGGVLAWRNKQRAPANDAKLAALRELMKKGEA